jgi:hypothetical protein
MKTPENTLLDFASKSDTSAVFHAQQIACKNVTADRCISSDDSMKSESLAGNCATGFCAGRTCETIRFRNNPDVRQGILPLQNTPEKIVPAARLL